MHEYAASFVRAVDGDTLILDVDLGFYVTVRQPFRLARVNCPELNSTDPTEHKRAAAAQAFSAGFCGGPLTVKTSRSDDWRRWIAEVVRADGTNLSDALLAAGLAVLYVREPRRR